MGSFFHPIITLKDTTFCTLNCKRYSKLLSLGVHVFIQIHLLDRFHHSPNIHLLEEKWTHWQAFCDMLKTAVQTDNVMCVWYRVQYWLIHLEVQGFYLIRWFFDLTLDTLLLSHPVVVMQEVHVNMKRL
jgi:phosphorylcholine metabolism protein LicD